MDPAPPNKDTVKKEKKEIDAFIETLPDSNKSKTIDDRDNKYEDNKVKKIKLSKDMRKCQR